MNLTKQQKKEPFSFKQYYKIIELYFRSDLTTSEIAEVVGYHESTVIALIESEKYNIREAKMLSTNVYPQRKSRKKERLTPDKTYKMWYLLGFCSYPELAKKFDTSIYKVRKMIVQYTDAQKPVRGLSVDC